MNDIKMANKQYKNEFVCFQIISGIHAFLFLYLWCPYDIMHDVKEKISLSGIG